MIMQKNEAKSLQIRRMTYAALYLAIAMVLPFITGQIPEIGAMLCPMHIPALLCGFMCGWPWGLAVGFIAPILRSVVFGMPAMFPGAVAMAFELAVYGGMAGFLRQKLPRKKGVLYTVLLISMVAGRLVWGTVRVILAGLSGSTFTWALFLAGAVTNAIPGIILQLVLIPVLVLAMERAGLSLIPQEESGEP
ncbi:MAG: ECF transporter S component [Clostridiales bacterium]|nr:ECF transporter S component [Clostridiales bacterium]